MAGRAMIASDLETSAHQAVEQDTNRRTERTFEWVARSRTFPTGAGQSTRGSWAEREEQLKAAIAAAERSLQGEGAARRTGSLEATIGPKQETKTVGSGDLQYVGAWTEERQHGF